MSNLIFQGNTIDNFGEFLPAPYIETIKIYNDSFEISLCFFLTVTEGENVDEVIARLGHGSSGIRPYLMFAFNQMEYGLSPVITGKKNIFDYYVNGDWLYNVDNQSFDTLVLDINEYLWENYSSGASAYLIDENGNNVIKIQTTVTQTLSGLAGGENLTWSRITDFRIFAFSSVYDVFTDRDKLNVKLSNPAMFKRETSDISYEKIMENGSLVQAQSIEFFDRNKEIYNPQPLRSISGRYYKTKGGGRTNNQRIIDYFNDLNSTYADNCLHADKAIGPALTKIMKNIIYILETHIDDPNLLVHLNMLRKVFPTKSLSTEVGKFYRRYTKRIFTINKAIESSPRLFKKVIRNPKIFDEREASFPAWSTPSHYDSEPWNRYLYGSEQTLFTIDIHVLHDSMSDGDNTDIVVNSGYVWFDYEKALKQVADFNQIAPISKLEKYGIPVDYTKFRVKSAKYVRTHTAGSGGTSNIIATLDVTALYPISRTSEINNHTGADEFMMVTTPYMTEDALLTFADLMHFTYDEVYDDLESAGYLVEPKNTYMILRNFEPLNGNTVWHPDYRLMCFEIQDYMRESHADNWGTYIDFEVTVEDSSIEIFTLLKDEYQSALRNLNDNYIDLAYADNPLSYDMITGLFNQYFIDGITALYGDDVPNAPWFRAPLLYVLFRDLILDEFDGNISKIVEETTTIANNINPINGTYYSILQLAEDMESFWDDVIAGSGLGSQVNSLVNLSGNEKVFDRSVPVGSFTWTATEPEEEASGTSTGGGGDPGWTYPGDHIMGDINEAQKEVVGAMEEPGEVKFEGGGGGSGVWGGPSGLGGVQGVGGAGSTGNF